MKPKTIIFEDAKEIPRFAIDIIKKQLKKKPATVFGVPTGKTVVPLYQELVKVHKKEKIDFSKAKIFNIDEYIGLKPEHKSSLKHFLDKNLYTKINVKEKNINFLNGSAINIKNECEQYEEKIKKARGIDLMFLGLGVNGHIAFNEPGSPPESRTREIVLTHQSRATNFGMISYLINAPKRAITTGIATILDSKKIILIATGKHKAKAVKAMLESPVSSDCPASFLRKHKDTIVLLDKQAASLLKS